MADRRALHELFLAACAQHGDRCAVVDDGTQITYREFAARVRERADRLARSLSPREQRVALYASNSADYLVSYYALLAGGRLPFLVDAQFGATELHGIVGSCGVRVFLTDKPHAFPLPGTATPVAGSLLTLMRPAPVAAPPVPVPVPAPTTATCRFTSGTTGAPKCLEFSAAAVHSAARNWMTGTGLEPDDRVLCMAAFTNGLAFNTSLLATFLAGAELHVYRGLPTSSGVIRALRGARATRLVAFPLVYRVLAEAPDPDPEAFAHLRRAISAAATLPPEHRAAFESRYGVRIADYYGIAETGPCTYERDPDRTAGLGTALPGVALRIVERETGEPEVLVRTESMASRYLNVPGGLEARIDEDGFYRTGDRGHLDDGRLFVSGRLDGPLNLAGRKVDPTEIERVLTGLDGVHDAVVFADHDAQGGTVLHAVLSGPRDPGRAEVIDACRVHLAPYKVPGRVTHLPAIPRSSAGKVRLTELKELVRTA
ncbi:class I adenylate-forming enzyme family protein [Streptomyces fragilis]|uniref:Class I adenylate-forming enzyme family protein n=1 Tax=Streptomyces fragilis TaxID=67301 RepID=A0ABV2YK96_9ACTN|nr:class I adenylate-forming enzyme family protein [Streptomyces fragilis]